MTSLNLIAAAYALLIADRLAELEGRPFDRGQALDLARRYDVPEASTRRALSLDAPTCRKALDVAA